MSRIVRIDHHTANHAAERIDPLRLVAGSPHQTVANAYSDPGNAFHCGVWEGQASAWRVAYTEHEFCAIY